MINKYYVKSFFRDFFPLFALVVTIIIIFFINQNTIKITPETQTLQPKVIAEGKVSWYDYHCRVLEERAICKTEFCGGALLDFGDCYSQQNLTCASRDFKRGTILLIENIDNGNTTICRVNDYVENPDVILDLSSKAFAELAPLSIGIINIKIYERR
jgi:rare lipoprotein A (peptidoglycan hydrolase)